MKLLRFDSVPLRDQPNVLRVGAVFLTVLMVLLYAGYTKHIPLLPKGGKVITAEFADASNVRGGTDVRIHGVNIGKVEKITHEGSGAARKAVVKMRIDNSSDADLLRSDTHASIYWRTLLGRNMYIELDPGTAPQALGSATIPAARTQTQVEFDQALEPLDKTGRKAVQQFLAFVDDGFQLQAAPAATIDRADPAMRTLAPAARSLRGQHTGDLIGAIRSTRDIAKNLDKDDARLGRLIDSGAVSLGVTAARRADLSGAMSVAPATLDVTRREMVSLRGTLDRVDPVADELRPGARRLDATARALSPALDDARPVLRDAKPLLRDLDPTVERLQTAAQQGNPLIAKLQPTVDRLNAKTVPFLDSRHQPSNRHVYELIGPTFSALASATANFDANGHDISFQPGAGLRLAEGFVPCSAFLTDPTAAQKVTCDGFLKGLNQLFGGTPAKLSSAPAAASSTPSTATRLTSLGGASLKGGGASSGNRAGPAAAPAGSALNGFWAKASHVLGKEQR